MIRKRLHLLRMMFISSQFKRNYQKPKCSLKSNFIIYSCNNANLTVHAFACSAVLIFLKEFNASYALATPSILIIASYTAIFIQLFIHATSTYLFLNAAFAAFTIFSFLFLIRTTACILNCCLMKLIQSALQASTQLYIRLLCRFGQVYFGLNI